MLSANLSAGNYEAGVARRHATLVSNVGCATTRFFRQIPDLVNGPANTLVHIFVGAGLAEPWRWVTDAMFANMDVGEAARVTDNSLRSRVVAEAAFHSLKLVDSGVAQDKARSMALTLAAGRVAMRRAWGIANADIVATQMMDVTVPPEVAAAVGPAPAALVPAGLEADGSARNDVFAAASGTAASYNAERAALEPLYDAMADDVLLATMQIAIGMPACNGVTLVTTLAHHYVDPHKQVCDAVVDQFMSDDTPLPAAMSKDEYRDVVCHKTAHVVETPRLVGIARSEDARARLESIGQGAATVRIPAQFEAERAAAALQAVVRKGASASRKANVVVDQQPVDDLVAATVQVMVNSPNAQGTLAAKALVNDFKQAHGYGVAWLAGYLKAMYDDIGANRRARSAISARTLEGLIEDFEEAYADGADHYLLAAKWRKARAKEGFLDGHGLFGAQAPDPFGAPESQDAATTVAAPAAVPPAGP